MIAIGAVLLMLPISSSTHTWTNFPDALFMSTSATCVTGLSVVECGDDFSPFGQAVLLVLMQVGGFGFMASATLLLLAFGRSVGLREKLVVGESMGVERLGGLLSLLLGIAFFSHHLRRHRGRPPIHQVLPGVRLAGTAMWQSIFHAVSAFNNCGLDILGQRQQLRGVSERPPGGSHHSGTHHSRRHQLPRGLGRLQEEELQQAVARQQDGDTGDCSSPHSGHGRAAGHGVQQSKTPLGPCLCRRKC